MANFQAVFELCGPEENAKSQDTSHIVCASKTELQNWMRNKYIFVVANQKNFIQHKFGEDRFKARAEAKYYALNSEAKSDYVNMITRTSVELYDTYLSVAHSAREDYKGFTMEQQPTRTIPYDNHMRTIITFEISHTKTHHFREVYSIMDFFSDSGGLFTFFFRSCLLVVIGLNYFGSYQFLMAETFYRKSKVGVNGPFAYGAKAKIEDRNDVQWRPMKAMMLNLRTFLP